ncbi:hypothetical protein LT493_27085 [Streptomyces tricolor]|nr:hypothetical protein [Streptomyces tricolor]
MEAAGRRLQELLLAGAVPHLGSGQVVIVPPGTLHRVPWALPPALRERVLSVSPSAGSWLRAWEMAPPPDGRPVLVRGPGLATAGRRCPELADRVRHGDGPGGRRRPGAPGAGGTRRGGPRPPAAHGTFRADSSLSPRPVDGRRPAASSTTSSAWPAARTGSSSPAATPPASPRSAPTNPWRGHRAAAAGHGRGGRRAAHRSTTRRWCC